MSENTNLPTTEEQNANSPVQADEGIAQVTSSASDRAEPKDLQATEETGVLEQHTGEKSGKRSVAEEAIHEHLAERIYDGKHAFWREYLQNSETACIRAAMAIIKHHPDGPGAEWLTVTHWVNEDGETVLTEKEKQHPISEYIDGDTNVRAVEMPRSVEEIVSKARQLGYEPVIEIDVYKGNQSKVVWRDNGVGMTAYEVDEAFNTTGMSGVKGDANTGGRMGLGNLTFDNLMEEGGAMLVETVTRLPTSEPNVTERDHEGIVFYSSLGGWDEQSNDRIPDGFKGTRFTIPVGDKSNLNKCRQYVKKYTSGLRVPVLYQEHKDGSIVYDDEWGDVNFVEKFDHPPVTIERPGEFSVFGGPDVDVSGRNTTDTWLVSMPIDRNAYSNINSFWNLAIQIHDEQGRIIAGPNRGGYHKDGKVYETEAKKNQVAELHEDDVPLPEPTSDRDRLQRNRKSNKRFMKYVEEQVKELELANAAEVAQEMKNTDNLAEVIRGSKNKWQLFDKMVRHYSRGALRNEQKLKSFFDGRDDFPDFADGEIDEIYRLFKKVSVAPRGSTATKKRRRSSRKLGSLLAEDPERVYMAASTSGAFVERKKVVEHNFSKTTVIVVKYSSRYEPLQEAFGFKKLKEVPREPSDDHDFDIPRTVFDPNNSSSGDSSDGDDSSSSEILKIRRSADDTSIDRRTSVADIEDTLEDGGRPAGKNHLVLFSRGDGPNISDYYWLSAHAAIAVCKKTTYKQLSDYDRVWRPEEFLSWSSETPIATEEGFMSVSELAKKSDDRYLIFCYDDGSRTEYLDDGQYYTDLRELLKDDMMRYARGSGKHKEPLFCLVDKRTMRRAAAGLRNELKTISRTNLVGIRWSYCNPVNGDTNWRRINGSIGKYRRKAETPNWDNDSEVYKLLPSNRDSVKYQMLLAFHDEGIDPADLDADNAREAISIDSSKLDQ